MNNTHRNEANRHSGFGAVGLGFLSGSLDDDDDQDTKPVPAQAAPMATTVPKPPASIPLAAPRPGYPLPVAALKNPSPSSSAFPESHHQGQPPQMSQVPLALRLPLPQAAARQPRMPPPIYQTPMIPRSIVPSTPHPLQPPSTPITPVFVRPSKLPSPKTDVKFAGEVIMRGNSEDNLIPKRGEHGDHFWRRFSMVAKAEKKPSSWLLKAQGGASRMSRWVAFLAVLILIGIGLVVAYELVHRSSSNSQPTAIGGKANETAGATSTPAQTAGPAAQSTSLHVTPTYTVARRAAAPEPTPLDSVFAGEIRRSEDVLERAVPLKVARRRRHRRHAQQEH